MRTVKRSKQCTQTVKHHVKKQMHRGTRKVGGVGNGSSKIAQLKRKQKANRNAMAANQPMVSNPPIPTNPLTNPLTNSKKSLGNAIDQAKLVQQELEQAIQEADTSLRS